MQVVVRQRAVFQRAGLVPDPAEVALGELVGVGDDVRPARHIGQVRLECRRVHRHQYVGGIAGGQDVMIGEMQLEAGHPRQGACRGPDLRREVRQRRKVIAERGGLLGKPVTGQLHPIAGIASEPDYDAVEVLDLLGHS